MNAISSSLPILNEIDGHRLYLGRCEHVLARLPEESVDVVCTSPPYNIGIPYQGHEDNLPEEEYLEWIARVAVLVWRVMKPEASFFLNLGGSPKDPWVPYELPVRLRALRHEDGRPLFWLQNPIAWVKSITVEGQTRGQFKPLNTPRYLNRTHETILHLTKTGNVPIDRLAIGVEYADKSNIARFGGKGSGRPDKRCRGNTWFIPYETVQSREAKFNHPAGFPLDLPRDCIRLHGVEQPVVLDPFSGTGTTVLAAALEGGYGVGVEKSQPYHQAACDRLRAALSGQVT